MSPPDGRQITCPHLTAFRAHNGPNPFRFLNNCLHPPDELPRCTTCPPSDSTSSTRLYACLSCTAVSCRPHAASHPHPLAVDVDRAELFCLACAELFCLVRHQKLCLSVDLPNSQIRSYTDLEIAVPDISIVGLHAENLGIGSVFVDGEPAEFEYYPRPATGDRSDGPDNAKGAADTAGAAYVAALERELVPNLLINCCKAFRVSAEAAQADVDNGAQSSGESCH